MSLKFTRGVPPSLFTGITQFNPTKQGIRFHFSRHYEIQTATATINEYKHKIGGEIKWATILI